MGMGGLVKPGEKSGAGGGSAAGDESKAAGKATSRPAMPAWATGGFGRTAGDAATEKARKKSVVEEQEEDDRHIRFTINNVGQRMTKEDFIREMQKLEKSKRRDVVEASTASTAVKTLARQDAQPKKQQGQSSTQSAARGKETAVSAPIKPKQPEPGSVAGSSKDSSGEASRSRSMSPSDGSDELSQGALETDAERRRRAAALKGVGGSAQEEPGETPAERRRREAALGMSSTAADDDSEDDDTPRVPPPKRGIRFADVPDRGRD